MNLFSRKLRLLSLLVSSTILATLATPQATIAAPMAAKLSGIERIVASSGFSKYYCAAKGWQFTAVESPRTNEFSVYRAACRNQGTGTKRSKMDWQWRLSCGY